MSQKKTKVSHYTHKDVGGRYTKVIDAAEFGTIKGAGTMKGIDVVLYNDIDNHQIYVRTKEDFDNRMVAVYE